MSRTLRIVRLLLNMSAACLLLPSLAESAIPELEALAKKGDTSAQYRLAIAYRFGDEGAQMDIAKAEEWFAKAAANGHDQAQIELAILYFDGELVKRDGGKAFKLMNRPAKAGMVQAQYYLGQMYELGVGIGKNGDKAMLWYRRADLGGYEQASQAIDRLEQARETAHQAKIRAQAKKEQQAHKQQASVIKTKAREPGVRDRILGSHWVKNGKPAGIFPSSLTSCRIADAQTLVCKSGKQAIRVPGVDGSYKTKAIVHDFKKNGEFSVTYRNLVIEAKAEFPDSAEATRLSKGWQNTEHQLVCRFNAKGGIDCIKNKTMKQSFTAAGRAQVSVQDR